MRPRLILHRQETVCTGQSPTTPTIPDVNHRNLTVYTDSSGQSTPTITNPNQKFSAIGSLLSFAGVGQMNSGP